LTDLPAIDSLEQDFMKKYILSPLCSALIIPGLGQILNNNLKKGCCLLAIVFILFIAGTVKLAFMVNSILRGLDMNKLDFRVIQERLRGEDISVLWLLLAVFSMVWIYSVLDAFWMGKKLESQTKDQGP